MSKDLASEIVNDLVGGEATSVVEATAVAAPEPVQTQDAAPVPVVAPAVATPVEAHQPKQDHTVPLPTFLDMRDQNKALKARLAELEKQPAPVVPSATADPDAFARYQAELVNSTRTNTVFDMSEVMATEKYGQEPVKAAMDWAMGQAQASPAFAAEYLKQKHPIDWAVKQQKRHALLDDIGDDPDAYVARKIAEKSAAAPDAPAPSQPLQAAIPPTAAPIPAQVSPTRSLASAPTAGAATSVPAHPVAAIEAVFQ